MAYQQKHNSISMLMSSCHPKIFLKRSQKINSHDVNYNDVPNFNLIISRRDQKNKAIYYIEMYDGLKNKELYYHSNPRSM